MIDLPLQMGFPTHKVSLVKAESLGPTVRCTEVIVRLTMTSVTCELSDQTQSLCLPEIDHPPVIGLVFTYQRPAPLCSRRTPHTRKTCLWGHLDNRVPTVFRE